MYVHEVLGGREPCFERFEYIPDILLGLTEIGTVKCVLLVYGCSWRRHLREAAMEWSVVTNMVVAAGLLTSAMFPLGQVAGRDTVVLSRLV